MVIFLFFFKDFFFLTVLHLKVFDKLTHMNLFSKMTSEAAKTKQRSSQNRLLYAM